MTLFASVGFAITACLICRSADQLIKDRRKLQEMTLWKQDRLQKLFALCLIRGDVLLREEYEEYAAYFELPCRKCFVAVTAVPVLGEEPEAQDHAGEDADCLRLVEEMPERLKGLAWITPVCNAGAVVAILADDDGEKLLERVKEYNAGLQKFSLKTIGRRFLTGVSAIHTDPLHIHWICAESTEALALNAAAEKRNGPAPETSYHSEYVEYEKRIRDGIKNIDKAQCYSVMDDYFDYLWSADRGRDEILLYVMRMVNIILLTAMEIRINLGTMFPNGFRGFCVELLEIPELSREKRYIKKNLIDPILTEGGELLKKRSYSMMTDIEQMLRERRGDISLSECAEIMGVHPAYIWKILKEERGKTFSGLQEEYKLEEAKRLLTGTDMTVSQIALELNYTNAQNFIRFFSRNTGMTPGQFRKSN